MNTLAIHLEDQALLSFSKHVGWGGVGLYAVAMAVALAHLYAVAEFTLYFKAMNVDGIWVFFVCAVAAVVLVLYHAFAWKRIAQEAVRGPRKSTPTGAVQRLKAWKASFDMNGKHFILKLYALEIMESIMQGYNLATLYTCALPPGVVLALCLFLALDHVHRVLFIWQPLTAHSRDHKVLVDLCVDTLCVVFPLGFIWFGYRVPLLVGELVSVVALPTLFVLFKLDELMEENVRRRSSAEVVQLQRKRSMEMKRRRLSLFQRTVVESGVEQQKETVAHPCTKWAVTIVTLLFGLFFLGAGTLAVAVSPECDSVLWGGCKVKVPLCQFRVSCNCAVLDIQKHNMTALPASIESMTAMKKLQINHGPLKALPEVGNFMPLLAHVHLDFNRLETLPASLAKAENLAILYAAFNEIASIPEALFLHDGIVQLDLSTNQITGLPKARLAALQFLSVVNNSLSTLPNSVFESVHLGQLFVDGNRLKSLPSNAGNLGQTLTKFGASRNNMTSLPLSFQRLAKLEVLDLRNNSLAYLPEWLSKLTALQHLTVRGNPLCSNGWTGSGSVQELMEAGGGGCERQCSEMCLDIYLDNAGCDQACNVPQCNHDNGKCG